MDEMARGAEDVPVSVRLTRSEIARLDEVARRLGYSRSHLVRLILRRGLGRAGRFTPRDKSADLPDPGPPASGPEETAPAA